jgi:hypothetical protein
VDGARSVGDSHEWEEKCKRLLAIRYGDELQLIDASRLGDLGLEAFARTSGLAFQCYAPLEPLSTKDRYEKHRDKLTRDLGKLATNAAALAVILGTTSLRRYVFMVPQFDPQLLEHCGRKSGEMRALGLAILEVDFDIVVQTEDNYPLELAQLIELALEPLLIEIPEVEAEVQARWAAANVPLVATLTEKIGRFRLSEKDSLELRDEFLRHYLSREQLLGQILDEAPEIRARLERRIRQRETLLATARLMAGMQPLEHANSVVRELKDELLNESKALQPVGAEALAYGTAADWLIRCPLDFNANG